MTLLSKEDFLNWAKENDSERGLSETDYGLLYDYVEAYGYSLCIDAENCMYRVDTDDDGIILYFIDEMIREVSAWNEGLLSSYSISLKIADVSSECKETIHMVIDKLKTQEKILERMYLTTKLGKLIKLGLEKIVEEGV